MEVQNDEVNNSNSTDRTQQIKQAQSSQKDKKNWKKKVAFKLTKTEHSKLFKKKDGNKKTATVCKNENKEYKCSLCSMTFDKCQKLGAHMSNFHRGQSVIYKIR